MLRFSLSLCRGIVDSPAARSPSPDRTVTVGCQCSTACMGPLPSARHRTITMLGRTVGFRCLQHPPPNVSVGPVLSGRARHLPSAQHRSPRRCAAQEDAAHSSACGLSRPLQALQEPPPSTQPTAAGPTVNWGLRVWRCCEKEARHEGRVGPTGDVFSYG